MIYATLATYPPRLCNLKAVIDEISPQVDRLTIILNEYSDIPDVCRSAENVHAIIPERDTKDTGKFLPRPADDDWLFTIDDDLFYPPDYVATSIAMLEKCNVEHAIGGYHGSIYRKHKYLNSRFLRRVLGRDPNFIVSSRKIFGCSAENKTAFFVDQLGTGVAFMRGRDVPPFDSVSHGQRFVDVAAANWWHNNGRRLICLPRAAKWITLRETIGETIIHTFTEKNPPHVADEVYRFVFKQADIGKMIDTCTLADFTAIHEAASDAASRTVR